MSEVQAFCDLCKQPLGHDEAVTIWRYVYHPQCAEEVHRRLMRFWNMVMSIDMDGSDCATCLHLPPAPEGWHCAKHPDAPVDCDDWQEQEAAP